MDYRSIIESKYNRLNWQNLLHDIFRQNIQFWQTPQSISVNSTVADKALYTGKITLPDKQIIAVYEVELSDSVKLDRNRVGIRNLLCANWRGMGCAGAFMFCFRKDEAVLRFSYVSESFVFAEDGSLAKESTETKRFTYLLGEGHRSRTAIKQFEKLRDSGLTLKDITKAFSVEALSEMFFREYKKNYEDIIEYITGKRMVKVSNRWEEQITGTPCLEIISEFSKFKNSEKTIRDYVKKLMGRLVFIQFLQKKGWMGVPAGNSWSGGDKEFLQNLFSNSQYQNTFVDDVLEPLFKDINTPREGDLVSNPNVGDNIKVPYLNGGLFGNDEYDDTKFPLPCKYMKQLLEFFAAYNFTIDENDPDDAEIGVDPEMLGRIFENLLEDNKDKGAFYTPKEIVQYMCRQSLIAYLQTNICDEDTKESINSFVKTYDVKSLGGENSKLAIMLDQKLKDVKICDPAIGSGAFPMGLLKELYLCRGAIERFDDAASIKRHIIQQNIYGVDIEKGAVDIARLRFWLSLVVDENSPQSLPNLDYKIMQGNSLLEQYNGNDLSRLAVRKQEIINNNMSLDIFDDIMDVYRNDLRKKITAYFSCCNHDEKHQLLIDIHENILKQIDDQRLPIDLHDLDIQSNDKFFLWHTWFSDVFNRPNGCNGFDIVIGNPPYFLYQESHFGEIHSIRKDKDYNIAFGGKLNAYKLFIANALNKLLSKNGVNCFIFQNSFLGDRQATKLRYYVLSDNKILNIDSYPERDSKKKRVFESVKMSVCIVLVQKSKVSSNYYFPVNIWDDKEATTGIHTSFSFDEICSIDKVDYTIPRIRQEDKSLVIKLIEKKEIAIKCIEGELNMTLHKKYFTNQESYPLILKGAAIQRYFYTKQMSQGKIEYLDEERYLQDCGNTEKSRHHNLDRIAMQGMTGANDKIRLVMTIIPKGFYLANSCNYILPTDNIDIYCLLGILNSKLMNWFFRCFSTNSNVNGYEIDNFPIPQLDNQLQNKISQLVLQILHQSNVSQIKIKEIEKQIDIIVYKIYKLNSDEIKLITES